MEVHKHPHHITHKKKWTEYLLEFFMLFLAVFLGFVAENIRESSVEHHKEKEYVKSLMQNLKDDTTLLNWDISHLAVKIKKLDSMVLLSKTDLTQTENLKAVTRLYIGYGVMLFNFRSNNATLSQLKAGSFRLIQKDHVADSIARYDLLNSYTEVQGNLLLEFSNNLIYSGEQVFDYSIVRDTVYFKNFIATGITPPALNSDKEKQRAFFNKVVSVTVASEGYLRFLKFQSQYANRLLILLQKEYHLEKE